MPRIIFKCPYIKPGTAKAAAHLNNYVRYVATRDGVEKLTLRLNRFIKRLNEAGYTYLRTHDVDAYLREIDICCEMPGVKKAVVSGIPARDYVMILKIRTLREAGRGEEARALLESAKQSMKGDKAQLLLKAEEEMLGGQS